ncbi:MAG: hypothetical protein JNK82_28885 [Myxococcaceae bacterium]|nr:hypothetical protein [Myxococcaceae bacterium]
MVDLATFSRLSWALSAAGAPPELLEQTHRAALDALAGRDVRAALFQAVHEWVALQAQQRAARPIYGPDAQVGGPTEGGN